MAGGRESLLIAILLFAGVCRASELVPFIAWSNSDSLSSLQASEDLDEITASLSQTKPDLTVIFITSEFSFDDLAKYGGVFGDGSDGAFSGLKTSLKKAESQYWTGVSPSDSMWIIDFSRLLGEKATFVDPAASSEPGSWNGLVVVDLSAFEDYSDKDAVVKNVMSDLGSGDSSFLAVFTQGSVPNEEDFKPRSERSADPHVRQNDPDETNNDCPIAGVFSDCLLLCMQPPVRFIPNINDGLICNLTTPQNIDYVCQNVSDPYVTLTYNVPRVMTDEGNNCTGFADLVEKLGGEVETSSLLISLRFNFFAPNTSDYYASYYMNINATVRLNDNNTLNSSTVVLERMQPENLYDNFSVPVGLSYACGASNSVYNNYTSGNISVGIFEGPTIMLTSIQVQPFNVTGTTFATAYNCIGYFTLATWMGIFTVLILILAFYLSIVCTFSMKTVDRFEDPRGQTILVEKLH